MTATQLSGLTGLSLGACGDVLLELSVHRHRLVRCLNPTARRSRLYWLTSQGQRCQRCLCRRMGLRPLQPHLPQVDWDLYGWVCYRHRAAVLRALTLPIHGAAVRRKAVGHDPELRMSANNTRDVLGLFVQKGIALKRPPQSGGRMRTRRGRPRYPRYELTELGQQLQALLLHVEPLHHANMTERTATRSQQAVTPQHRTATSSRVGSTTRRGSHVTARSFTRGNGGS